MSEILSDEPKDDQQIYNFSTKNVVAPYYLLVLIQNLTTL